MFRIISSIQDMLLKQKNKKLVDLKYKNLTFHNRPTELENTIPIKYFDKIQSPSSNDSEQTKKELLYTQKLTTSRKPEIIDTVLTIDKDPLIIFKHFLSKRTLYFPELQFNQLYSILYEIVLDIKYYYNRPRPNQIAEFYNINLDIISTKTHHTPSYPSGHTAYAALAYELLTELYPEYNTKFKELLSKVSKARLIQGIHFESDNEASISLVHSIYPDLKKIIMENYHE